MSLYKICSWVWDSEKNLTFIFDLENSIPVNVFLKITGKSLFRCEYMCLYIVYMSSLVDQTVESPLQRWRPRLDPWVGKIP